MFWKLLWPIFAVLVGGAPLARAETTGKVTCLGWVEDEGKSPFPYVPYTVGAPRHLHWIRAADDAERKGRLDRHPGWSALCWANIPAELWEKKVKPICDTDDMCVITGTVVIKEEGVGDYWKTITTIRKQ
jgi:hypothetical protein